VNIHQLERITKVPKRRILRYGRLGFVGERCGETIELSEADIYPLKIICLLEQSKQSVRKIIEVIDAKRRNDTARLQALYIQLLEQAEQHCELPMQRHLRQLAAELNAFIDTP
jgi:hypothetical protein